MRFAGAYDPQHFHLDEENGPHLISRRALCQRLAHRLGMMRSLVDSFQREGEAATARGLPISRIGPSPGFDDLRWLKPVFPGDTVTFTGRVVAKRPSQSRPGWGIVTTETTGINQHGDPVFSLTAHIFAARTNPG